MIIVVDYVYTSVQQHAFVDLNMALSILEKRPSKTHMGLIIMGPKWDLVASTIISDPSFEMDQK